jgi:mono/diheme cytochrome c family protein
VLVLGVASPAMAQSSGSTRGGVYSDAQAIRGRDVYLGNCKSCHSPESHTGAIFRSSWEGRPLAELFAYVSERMPKNEPGSLSPQENADVVAYLLQLNRMPPGAAEIPADSTAMRSIRIETPPTTRKDP